MDHPQVDTGLHVQGIRSVIKWRDRSDIVQVGHSCGGTIMPGVAGQGGVSLYSQAKPECLAFLEKQRADGAFPMEPEYFKNIDRSPAEKHTQHLHDFAMSETSGNTAP